MKPRKKYEIGATRLANRSGSSVHRERARAAAKKMFDHLQKPESSANPLRARILYFNTLLEVASRVEQPAKQQGKVERKP